MLASARAMSAMSSWSGSGSNGFTKRPETVCRYGPGAGGAWSMPHMEARRRTREREQRERGERRAEQRDREDTRAGAGRRRVAGEVDRLGRGERDRAADLAQQQQRAERAA